MEFNRWWTGLPDESFWLEVTGRKDIGTNLKAPQTDENGKEYWSYQLIREVSPGDVVFHYDRTKQSIVAASLATGGTWEDEILWASRSANARKSQVEPHLRDGIYGGLEGTIELEPKVTLREIRAISIVLAENLDTFESRVKKPTYYPFERGATRPVRATQGYLFKLPRFFLNQFKTMMDTAKRLEASDASELSSTSLFGTAYRYADERLSVAARDPFEIDPALVERGTRAHAATQNALAGYLVEMGIEPLSPAAEQPSFDLAWKTETTRYVAEVKSLSYANEEKQLRLGLGQVLRYRHLLARASGSAVEAILVAERKPQDDTWITVCSEVNVLLTWPGNFQNIFRA